MLLADHCVAVGFISEAAELFARTEKLYLARGRNREADEAGRRYRILDVQE